MKNNAKKLLCVTLAAVSAISLAACNSETAESSFDNPLPWHTAVASYEKLDYTVAVYNTVKSTDEKKREKIADGTMTFVLDEGAISGYTSIDMSFTVTYLNTEAAGADAGLTDEITSHVEFEPNSLAAKSMEKEVKLADRKDKTNNSYKITADYFGTKKATLLYTKKDGAKQKTRSLPKDASRDNEMMYFLARAQGIKSGDSTNFKMINVFDSFIQNETAEYRMVVSCTSTRKLDLGDWVKDFGIQQVKDEKDGTVAYPVNCFSTTLTINDDHHGPSYNVLYAKDAFVENPEEQDEEKQLKHKKLPIKIDYSSYQNSKPYRHTEYKLSAVSFAK